MVVGVGKRVARANDLAVVVDPISVDEGPAGSRINEVIEQTDYAAAIEEGVGGRVVAADVADDLGFVVDGLRDDVGKWTAEVAEIGHNTIAVEKAVHNSVSGATG